MSWLAVRTTIDGNNVLGVWRDDDGKRGTVGFVGEEDAGLELAIEDLENLRTVIHEAIIVIEESSGETPA